jgi:alginate O-acetyltransferase complex protein AlgI
MVIADNLKDHTFLIAYPYFKHYSTLTLLSLIFGFSMQIFADFAGYSLIAVGIACLFGYRLPQNFNFPYISRSFSDFWRRWHISLSTWLKDYLYISLGGNRKGKKRTYINLLIVMLLGGLWHGASWSYAVWGLWHGVALSVERYLSNLKKNKLEIETRLLTPLKVLFVFIFVTFAWLLFKLPEFGHAVLYLKCIYENVHIHNSWVPIGLCSIYSLPVIIYHFNYLIANQYGAGFKSKLDQVTYSVLLFLIAFNSGDPGAFIYFQF